MFPFLPTTELEAVNTMLSGIGEAPVNSFSEVTADVSLARHVLTEVSRETQLQGFQWNTEDDYPLTPDTGGLITLHPSIVRVHFREPDDRELTIRGNRVYDRIRHTYTFPQNGRDIRCTVTLLLPFGEMPEAARRYVTLKALRVFQERVVGSQVLSAYQQADEARARVQLMGEERRQDRPNLLMGTLPPVGTWQAHEPLTARPRGARRRRF